MLPSSDATAAPAYDPDVQGLLLDIDRFASHDGPGIRSTVFLKGCPLACIWCHSPESRHREPELIYQKDRCTACWLCLDECPHGALNRSGNGEGAYAVLDRSLCQTCGACAEVCYPGALKVAGSTMTVAQTLSQVRKDIAYFKASGGGVTLSGGEPAAQPHFAYHFLKACQQSGIHTALETTGFAPWRIMASLAEVTDLFLVDVKFADADLHQRHTGVANNLILDNLARLARTGREIHVRVPCIPNVNDSPEQIAAVARLVSAMGLTHIVLLPYNSAAGAKYEWLDCDFTLPNSITQSQDVMQELADVCRQQGLLVQIGG